MTYYSPSTCWLFLFLCIFSFLAACADEESALPKPDAPEAVVPEPNVPPDTNLPCSKCTFIIPHGVRIVDALKEGIKPGDTVCFDGSYEYSSLTFENFNGTPGKEIIITNCNGPVVIRDTRAPFVLRFQNSTHFRISGGETDDVYGIKITGSPSNGLVLGYLTSNFEVDHLEVSNVGFSGIMAKTDPSCDDATIRGNYTMRDLSFHHNYIHDTHGEGFYIGHSSYMGKETDCGIRMPHVIENVKLYKNIVRNSGWDGIQMSSVTKGGEIYENIVENYSTGNKPAQRSGICIGGGTGGFCYNNLIRNGNGPGIQVFGLADNIIHNNIIINAGTVGIFCDERTEPGKGYRILHNTIINPNESCLLIYAEKVQENLIVNNIFLQEQTKGREVEHFLRVLSKKVNIRNNNNFFSNSLNDLKFEDAANLNFRLTSGSPVIDKGADITSFRLAKDFYSRDRLKGAQYDIGASEY